MEKVLVSACLVGVAVRYDGRAKEVGSSVLDVWRGEGRVVVFCPEVSGGLGVPRAPAEIVGSGGGGSVLVGDAVVRTDGGVDVTGAFVRGAELALEAARRAGVRVAVLKEGSPSCGSHRIYDGSFDGRAVAGVGVTTALLERHGVRVFSEDEWVAAAAYVAELEGRQD